MCLTESHWSSFVASSSLLRTYSPVRTRTGNATDVFGANRPRRYSHPPQNMVAVVRFSLDSFSIGRTGGGEGHFQNLKPHCQASDPGSQQHCVSGFVASNDPKRFAMVQVFTEEKKALVRKEKLLELRGPSSDRNSKTGSHYFESTEVARLSKDTIKSFSWKRNAKSKVLKLRTGERPYKENKPKLRGLQPCDPKVDEVIASLKQIIGNSGAVSVVMAQYDSISKTDISGVLTEFQLRRDWRGAIQFFKWMKSQAWYTPNSRQYTRLIGFLGREGKVDLACIYFQEMLLQKCKPDQYTFTALVNAYGKAKMYDEALDVFSYMKVARDTNCQPTTVTCNALVDSLMKGGKHEAAFKVFADMRLRRNGLDSKCMPNVVTYNILIDALCKEGYVKEAVHVLYKMDEGNEGQAVSPNVTTYNTMINACGKSGLYDKAEELLEHMIDRGHEPDRITYTALIDAYGKAGLCGSAENMFMGMKSSHIQVDVMAYTAMIDAYARAGQHENAGNLFKTMCEAGMLPNQITYLALIEAYGKSGLPRAAQEVFQSMKKAGLQANVLHYSALICAYGKADLHVEAADLYKLMKRAGCQPNIVTMSAILVSVTKCRAWDDAKAFLVCLLRSESELEDALYNFLAGGEHLWDPALQTLEKVKVSKQLRQSLYNALLDVLWHFEFNVRAAKVVAICKKQGLFVDEYSGKEWNLDLHGLSVGGALVALLSWLDELHVAWLWGEDVPPRVRIITGKGKHSRTKRSALKAPVENLLQRLGSPFSSTEEEYEGFLVASGNSVRAWLSEPGIKQKLHLSESDS